ncbi:hypothetical protein PGT21_033968 [Puccinia graminis f. sp. tritici]|uniref:Uncharacterized protein n=1 Tax=Puccinia graminis f. sp. tritici TaxID=56615 RepID=A0A5B0M234_PUCGR|nr:hypothetical protein PGT21_033968 [Puccinia graminis f. sp. tritici]
MPAGLTQLASRPEHLNIQSAAGDKHVTDPIPGSVFIGDRIENGPDTGYRYRIAPPNPIPMYWTTGIGWSDPIPIPGIGSIFDPIPDKYRSGDRIAYSLDDTQV